MEEQSPLTRWLGKEGAWLLASLDDDHPAAQDLLRLLYAGSPATLLAWQDLILACLQYGSVPHLKAILAAAPQGDFDEFPLHFETLTAVEDESFDLLVDCVWLPSIDKLASLRLWNVVLSAAAVQRMAEFIVRSTALRQLCVTQCELDADATHALWVAVLESRSPMRHLKMSYSAIPGSLTRAARLGRHPEHLTDLELVASHLTAEDAVALAETLGAWNGLKSLNLADNQIGDKAGAALLGAAVAHASLQTLNLENCQLGQAFGGSLVQLAGQTGPLHILELGRNDLARMPAGLGSALQRNRSLQKLDLFETHLTTERANDLLSGLASPQCALKILDISANALVALDVRPLATNRALEKLSLQGNQLPHATYQALADVLRVHPTLAWLGLDMASGDQTAMKHLADGIARTPSLRKLRLVAAVSLTDMQMRVLVAALKNNASLNAICVPYTLAKAGAMQWLFEYALKTNATLTDVDGWNFVWSGRSDAPKPIGAALTRNLRASREDLMLALHEVVKQCVVLGAEVLPDELAREIAWLLLGRQSPKSVEALRTALRMRQVNRQLASIPMPAVAAKR